MKVLRYNLKAKHAGDPDEKAWLEEQNVSVQDDVTPEQHGRKLIDWFNSTCHVGETHREFVDAIALDGKSTVGVRHTWEKYSLVTQKGGYDVYKCSTCGATGKRNGLSSNVVPDKRFTEFCKIKKKR
jgi:hypothetical protein